MSTEPDRIPCEPVADTGTAFCAHMGLSMNLPYRVVVYVEPGVTRPEILTELRGLLAVLEAEA